MSPLWQCAFCSCVHNRVVKNPAPARTMQDNPVPHGITGAFQRMLQIYREYRNAGFRSDDAQSAD